MGAVAAEAAGALRGWLASGARLPPDVCAPQPGSYARRLLCACPRGRFQVIAMTWAPGQSAPLHDHAGLWCVEGIYSGRMMAQEWGAPAPAGTGLVRFQPPKEWTSQQIGHVETVVPPQEFHVLTNPFQDPAVTIHIYGGRMRSCHTFVPEGKGELTSEGLLFSRRRAELRFTPAGSPSKPGASKLVGAAPASCAREAHARSSPSSEEFAPETPPEKTLP